MIDVLNLSLPYFGLIFVGFACGKFRKLPETGLAWLNFFLLYVSLPALLFRILWETPFSELNNPPFLIATTLATVSAFVLAMGAGDGQRAIELAMELRPDLVMLDIKMPVLDGISAAERIAAEGVAPVVGRPPAPPRPLPPPAPPPLPPGAGSGAR
jgi:hypothetical protein